MAEYRLTPAAERDLESIWSYTTRMTDFGIAVVRVLHDRMDALRHL